MNRSNVGNQVANGMQVLSVGGFTGGNWVGQTKRRMLADASNALNNKANAFSHMSEDEVNQVGEMRADKMREDIRRHDNKIDGLTHLSDKEQQDFGEKKAEDLRKYIYPEEDDEGEQSIDKIVLGIKSMDSPQGEELTKAILMNAEYTAKRGGGSDADV